VGTTAGLEVDVCVQPADRFGNLLRPGDLGQSDSFTGLSVMAGLQLEFVQIKLWQDQSIGLPITFLMTVAGRYTAMLLLNGGNISNSPIIIEVNPGPTSPLFSIANSSERKTTAGLPIVFKIQAFDAVRKI
jgi:hypothetical protein